MIPETRLAVSVRPPAVKLTVPSNYRLDTLLSYTRMNIRDGGAYVFSM
jgi:hypothetical protein